jgi:hypothetical protein
LSSSSCWHLVSKYTCRNGSLRGWAGVDELTNRGVLMIRIESDHTNKRAIYK